MHTDQCAIQHCSVRTSETLRLAHGHQPRGLLYTDPRATSLLRLSPGRNLNANLPCPMRKKTAHFLHSQTILVSSFHSPRHRLCPHHKQHCTRARGHTDAPARSSTPSPPPRPLSPELGRPVAPVAERTRSRPVHACRVFRPGVLELSSAEAELETRWAGGGEKEGMQSGDTKNGDVSRLAIRGRRES